MRNFPRGLRSALLPVLFAGGCLTATAQKYPEAETALKAINPDGIKASMTFLADDLLEGRQPGTRGFAIASKYVETQFMALGLKPGAEGGTSYIQKVPLQKGIVDESGSTLIIEIKGQKEVFSYGSDFILSPYYFHETSSTEAPLVFAGYGISAPSLGYDDYKDLDVKGKIVVVIDQAPETFPSNERAYFTGRDAKYAEAVKRGAVGFIGFSMPDNNRTSWIATVRRGKQGAFRWVDPQGKPANTYESLKGISTLNYNAAKKLFAPSGKIIGEVYSQLKAGKPASFDLGVSASIGVKTRFQYVNSSNLIGIIPGSDPRLSKEYVAYAAHVDHFGIGAVVDGDSIYNGAHDNASGPAILLQIAAAYKALPVAPKRSVVFTVVTAEESGLLGSDYFVSNLPGIPKENVVANLSIDMPFFFHPVLDIVPYGYQHSSLSKQVDEATSVLKLGISPDPFPEQVVFIRSDHFSFIKKGIPALFIKSGFKTVASDPVDRAKSDVAWRSTTYHTPKDDMNQAFDFDGGATHAKVNFLIGYFVCQDKEKPTWNKGDFFGIRFSGK